MEAYIYCADTYCPDCAEAIKAKLDASGERPNRQDYYEQKFDSDDYPKGPYADGGGESDCPQHCAQCHVPLGNPLTTDGIGYVIEHLRDYVVGSGMQSDALDGWAEDIADYSLTEAHAFVLAAYDAERSLERQLAAK